jgi:predicted DNA-binding ribbon-helix-helix protein
MRVNGPRVPRSKYIGPHGGRLDWHQLSIRLPEAHWKALQHIAERTGMPPSQQIQKLVDKYLQQKQEEPLRAADGEEA